MKHPNNLCIVTGGADGNGFAIAKALLAASYTVITIDVKAQIEVTKCLHVLGSVLDEKVIEFVYEKVINGNFTKVCLINNAGISLSPEKQDLEGWKKTIDTNLMAPYLWSKKYASLVASNEIKKGAIVNIGSLATIMGFPMNPSYQASKAGILGLTRSFAYDLGCHGITVNCVSPGYIHTNMTKISYKNVAAREQRTRHTLLARWGTPSDIANAVTFLCSDSASYITGINLPVDGGWAIKGLLEI